MADSQYPMASGKQLVDCYAKCKRLQVEMSQRQAGGGQKSGRYKAHDTSRPRCLKRVVLPDLFLGKLPSDYDSKMLFEMPGPSKITGPAKVQMDRWSEAFVGTTKSKAAQEKLKTEFETEMAQQTDLLRWVLHDGLATTDGADGQHGRVGCPSSYRFEFDSVRGKTMDEVIGGGNGGFLKFLCEGKFKFCFPRHEWVYLELLAQTGTIVEFTSFGKPESWTIKIPDEVHRRFEEFAVGSESDRRRRASEQARRARLDVDDGDDDGADADAPLTSLDRTENAVNGPTLARWKEILQELAQGVRPPYETWTSMTVHPADPMVRSTWSADAWEIQPIEFYDPVSYYQRLGVEQQYPCPRHGWAHARHTRVRSFRKPRLIRDGSANDRALSARDVCCSECQRERAAAKRAYDLACAQGGIEAAELAKLKAARDEVQYVFSAANPRVIAFLGERYSFIPALCDFSLSHRSAVTFDTMMEMARSAKTAQTPHDLEAQFDEAAPSKLPDPYSRTLPAKSSGDVTPCSAICWTSAFRTLLKRLFRKNAERATT